MRQWFTTRLERLVKVVSPIGRKVLLVHRTSMAESRQMSKASGNGSGSRVLSILTVRCAKALIVSNFVSILYRYFVVIDSRFVL